MIDSLLEYRNCPSCGRDDFEVLFDSNMGIFDLQEGIETLYMIPGGKYGRHVRCQSCEFIYVNPIEKASKISEDYSQMESADVSIIRRSRLRATKSQLGLIEKYKNGTHLLDIGCGEGFFLYNASKAGYNARGIELSQYAVGYAKSEFGLDIEAGCFREAQFPENYFDVVTMWQVLEHMPYPLSILKDAHRILKPGGLLAVSTPDIGGIPARVLRRRWWNIRRIHINQFTTETLMNMLQSAGLKGVSSTSYKESISISMLIIPVLKYFKLCERIKTAFYPCTASGRIMNKITLAYPSRLDNCIVVGFK